MSRRREDLVYRVRQLPIHLENRGDVAPFLVHVASDRFGAVDNIRVFSLAQERQNSKTATVTFKSLPQFFDNDEQQWTVPAVLSCGRNIIVDVHFRGFTVLNEPRVPSRATNCIAISGLASHPFGSWRYRGSGSDFMWLRDRLPQDVPWLRSLIYGYDTKLFESHSFQGLDDIAWSFIASLKEISRALPPAAPLFFLAHSLGGIVLKRALVLLAHEGGTEEKTLLGLVKGLVFFGVPHKGMETSHLLAMVKNQPNESLIRTTLSLNSDLLLDLDKEFSSIVLAIKQNMRFVYETAESQLTERTPSGTWIRSPTFYAVLVKKDSAIPSGTLPRHTIPVNEDHSNIAKLGEGDRAYEFIKSFLSDLRETSSNPINSQSTAACSETSPLGTICQSQGSMVDLNLVALDLNRPKGISTVPFPRDPKFVGREDTLAQLETELADPKSQRWTSLYGLGGIGKSQIAIEYSYRQQERSPKTSIFWVHASSKARFEQSYAEIAMKAKVPETGDGKVDMLQLVSTWLSDDENGPWLLILDNADDDTVLLGPPKTHNEGEEIPVQQCLLEYLPRTRHGVVVITTRDRSCALSLIGFRGTPVEVPAMSLDESVGLVRIYLPEAGQEEVAELVQELEKVPLAISQAGAYIKKVPRVTIPKYLAMSRRSSKDQVALLSTNQEDWRRAREVPNAVIKSWEISFNQIRKNSPGSADLLSLMSYMNRQAIPQFLIQENEDDIAFEEKLNTLFSFSLIRTEIGKSTFEVHRLVQIATQHWLRSEGSEQQWKERAIKRVARSFPWPRDQRQNWPVCEALMSHADEVLLHTGASKSSELNCAELLYRTAWYALERKGDYELAEQRSRRAFQIQRQYYDESSDVILFTLTILAEAQRGLGNYEEARGLQESIMTQSLRNHGPDDEDTLTYMHNLAVSHKMLGEYEKAEELIKRVLEAKRRLFGPDHSTSLSSESLLGSVYVGLAKFEDAEMLLTKLLGVYTRQYGFEHIHTLNVMRDLSDVYLRQNKFEEAEDLIEKAISYDIELFGPAHWRTLRGRTILAQTFFWQDKLDQAKEICLSSLQIAQEVDGPQGTITLRLSYLLGQIHRKQGNFVDAIRVLTETVQSGIRVGGTDHPNTLTSMQSLALCHYDMGDKNHAIRLMTKVLDKRKRVLPANHPHTTDSAKRLAYWKRVEEESEERDSGEEGKYGEGHEHVGQDESEGKEKDRGKKGEGERERGREKERSENEDKEVREKEREEVSEGDQSVEDNIMHSMFIPTHSSYSKG